MFRSRRSQEDFEAEIQAHIQLEEDRLVQEGMPRDQARFAARRAFGNRLAVAERFYESGGRARWAHLAHDLRNDLVYAFRTLGRSPGFAAAAVLTLALGIGANAAMFSVINAALLKPLPYANASRLVMLYGRTRTAGYGAISPADFLDYRDQAQSFAHLTACCHVSMNLTGLEQPERISGAVVTPDLFLTLGASPLIGRALMPDQDTPGGPRTAVISRALWQRRYASNPDIIGKAITVDGDSVTIVGVMPESCQFPAACDLWLSSPFAVPPHPLNPGKDNSASRDSHYMDVVGELGPGVTTSQATAEVSTIAGRLKQQYNNTEEEYGDASVITLRDDIVAKTRPALLVLLSAVGLLLFIACANVANLLLARGATRRKEITIRIALGARRWRVLRQLLTESLVLAIAGGGLGVIIAAAAMPLLRAMVPANVLSGGTLRTDAQVLAFTAAVSIASAAIFGLFPSLNLANSDLNAILKEGGRGSSAGARAHHTRSALVVSEIALATVLLIGATLLIRSFERLMAVPQGFSPDHVLTMQLSLSRSRYPRESDRAGFVRQVLERTSALPGISSAAVISRLPLSPGRSTRSMDIQGRTPAAGDPAPDYLVVSPDYFGTMGIQILRGRSFNELDVQNEQSVGIVSESAARYFWPGEDPIGKLTQAGAQRGWSPVVGVAADVHQHDLGDPPPLAIYVPYQQDPWLFMSLVVRTSVEPASVATAIQTAIHSVDHDQPVYNVSTMTDVVAASVSPQRTRMLLLALLAAIAATLACVGIYGVISYSIEQRTGEIGIRMALGAARGRLMALVVGEGMKLAAVGIPLGLLLSVGFGLLMSSLLFGVRPADPITFASISLLLGLVALVASYVPAWRAATIDPVAALRAE